MYVCICNAVTEKMIREAAQSGVRSVAELTMRTGCASTCGSCADLAADILHEARATASPQPFKLPLLRVAAAA